LYNAYDLHTVLLKGRVHAKGTDALLFLKLKLNNRTPCSKSLLPEQQSKELLK